MAYDSDYSIRLAQLKSMGGDMAKQYDSVYDVDLEILRLTEEGGGSPFEYDSSNGSISNKAFSPEGVTYVNSATGQNAITLGQGNTVSGEGSATIGGQGCSVTGDVSASVGGYNNTVSGSYAVILGGQSNTATKSNTCVIGRNNNATGVGSFAMGRYSNAEGDYSVAGGQGISTIPNRAIGKYSNVTGACVLANNDGETALGFANRSHKASTTRGDAGNTLFSVGDLASNTITDATRENAFEIMQNGDVYIKGVGGYQGTDTKVQDATIKTLQEYIASLEARIAALEGN